MDISQVLLFILLITSLISMWFSFRKSNESSNNNGLDKLIKLDADISRMDPLIREEFARNREENLRALREAVVFIKKAPFRTLYLFRQWHQLLHLLTHTLKHFQVSIPHMGLCPHCHAYRLPRIVSR